LSNQKLALPGGPRQARLAPDVSGEEYQEGGSHLSGGS